MTARARWLHQQAIQRVVADAENWQIRIGSKRDSNSWQARLNLRARLDLTTTSRLF